MLVYAIEASTMAEQAELIVQANALQDRITVIHGRIEVNISYFNNHIPDERVRIGCSIILLCLFLTGASCCVDPKLFMSCLTLSGH